MAQNTGRCLCREYRQSRPSIPPEVHVEPLPLHGGTREPPGTGQHGEPQAPGRLNPATQALPPGQARAPVRPAPVPGSSTLPRWQQMYALRDQRSGYMSTGDPGVFESLEGKQKVIFHRDQIYAVTRASDGEPWRLMVPGDPSQLGETVHRQENGEWEIGADTRSQEGAGTSSTQDRTHNVTSAPEAANAGLPNDVRDAMVAYVLRQSRRNPPDPAYKFAVSPEQANHVVSELGTALMEWRDITRQAGSGQTSRDESSARSADGFARRWSDGMSEDNIGTIIGMPEETFDDHMQFIDTVIEQCRATQVPASSPGHLQTPVLEPQSSLPPART
jgi:hypothetical protein